MVMVIEWYLHTVINASLPDKTSTYSADVLAIQVALNLFHAATLIMSSNR